MSAMKNFGVMTGLHPFSLNRTSFIVAFSSAALVIAKLVDAYLFCGFNQNFFVDLPVGVVLFFGYCFLPLLGLAVNRNPTTKRGRCCRMFAIVLICTWQLVTCGTIFEMHYVVFVYRSDDKAACDPFNICGSRTIDNVRAQFSNAMPAFDIFQRIDLIYKIAVVLGWFVLWPFPCLAFSFFFESVGGRNLASGRNHQAREDAESGNSAEDNGETIIWMEEGGEGKTEQPSAFAEHGSINIEEESTPDGAAQEAEERKSAASTCERRIFATKSTILAATLSRSQRKLRNRNSASSTRKKKRRQRRFQMKKTMKSQRIRKKFI